MGTEEKESWYPPVDIPGEKLKSCDLEWIKMEIEHLLSHLNCPPVYNYNNVVVNEEYVVLYLQKALDEIEYLETFTKKKGKK